MRRSLSNPAQIVDAAIAQSAGLHRIEGAVLLAISGGQDSMVLLDALARARDVGVLPNITINAIHVHHGLSDNADLWQEHARRECEIRNVRFYSRRPALKRNAQESLEEVARLARYAAFDEALSESRSKTLVLAHHQDDQAETLLLQLLRGAGPRGLSGMAAYCRRDKNVAIWRPLISVTREILSDYVHARDLSFVHDESNEDLNFKRNFLRHRVFPVIEEAFPAYRKTLARAALLQAQIVTMADESVTAEFPMAADAFRAQNDEAARAQLRVALRRLGLRAPSFATLVEMTRQLQTAREDSRVTLKVGDNRFIGIHRGAIRCYQKVSPYSILWRGEPVISLPHGIMRCVKAKGKTGVPVNPNTDTIEITSRKHPDEYIKRENRPGRTLGDLLRESDIPHWARDFYPRIYKNGTLVCVPNLGTSEHTDRRHDDGQDYDFIFEPNKES